jgi:hypothetical protein
VGADAIVSDVLRTDRGVLRRRAHVDLPRCCAQGDGRGPGCEAREYTGHTICRARQSTHLRSQVTRDHFLSAAQSIRRRITPDVLEVLEAWRDQAGVTES